MAAPENEHIADRDAKKQKVIDVLNIARSMELYAIHQYMYQHYTLDDEDYGALAAKMRDISISEMRHAEWFAERIKDLDGEPTSRMDGTVQKDQTVQDIYAFDREVEDDTLVKYNEFLKVCRDCDDYVSAHLFERVIIDEQEHWDYFDDTDNHIQKLGDHFLSKMAASGGAD